MRTRHGKEVLITQSGEEELDLRMRNALHLLETSGATTKSNKPRCLGVARQAAGRSDEMRGASFSFFRLSFARTIQRRH